MIKRSGNYEDVEVPDIPVRLSTMLENGVVCCTKARLVVRLALAFIKVVHLAHDVHPAHLIHIVHCPPSRRILTTVILTNIQVRDSFGRFLSHECV
jgi:hypothetical protein